MARDPLGDELRKQDWGDIHARLLRFALRRSPSVATAEEAVQEAIASVFARRSTWDPERVPDLTTFLMGVVRTKLWHERKKAARTEPLPADDEKDDDDRTKRPEAADDRAWSEARLAEKDVHDRRLARLEARLAANDDPDARRVLDLHAEGVDTPAEVQRETGWGADRVTKARLRLHRAALDVARADEAN